MSQKTMMLTVVLVLVTATMPKATADSGSVIDCFLPWNESNTPTGPEDYLLIGECVLAAVEGQVGCQGVLKTVVIGFELPQLYAAPMVGGPVIYPAEDVYGWFRLVDSEGWVYEMTGSSGTACRETGDP